MNDALLEIRDLHVIRGQVEVLRNINLYLKKGEVVALLGPNGAGKSTLFSSIVGVHRIKSGSIKLKGKKINGLPTRKISEGVSLVPQEFATFPYLTVLENLWIAKKTSKNELLEDKIFSIFPVLNAKKHQEACTLSGGERQMLTLGIGLARKTDLLILDEPTLGLAPLLVKRILSSIKQISESLDLSILVSEQTPSVLDIAERVYVIEGGIIRMQGGAKELKLDERIRKVYLGMAI